MFYDYCFLSILSIDNCENRWKSYDDHSYLFGFNKINWPEAKVSKIAINWQKGILFIYLLSLKILLSRVEGWDPINQFNSYIFLCLSQGRTWISNVICRSVFLLQWVKVRGSCSFCWYWWHWWPSLAYLLTPVAPWWCIGNWRQFSTLFCFVPYVPDLAIYNPLSPSQQ